MLMLDLSSEADRRRYAIASSVELTLITESRARYRHWEDFYKATLDFLHISPPLVGHHKEAVE